MSSPHSAPIVIRTTRELSAYLSGKPSPSAATIAALARMDALLRLATLGR